MPHPTPAEEFKAAFGVASPAVAQGVVFERGMNRGVCAALQESVGAGWFRDGFLYLFGEAVDSLRTCVDAWSFVVPPNPARVVLGRNAYGAILVLDNASQPRVERVFVLDPFLVAYTEVPNARFVSLVGRALPDGELNAAFLDRGAYDAWRVQHRVDRLGPEDILAPTIPKALGGALVPGNLQLENVVEYYRSAAPIYAKAFALLPPS